MPCHGISSIPKRLVSVHKRVEWSDKRARRIITRGRGAIARACVWFSPVTRVSLQRVTTTVVRTTASFLSRWLSRRLVVVTYFRLSLNPSKELHLQLFSYIKARYLVVILEYLSLSCSSNIVWCSRTNPLYYLLSFSYVESFSILLFFSVLTSPTVSHSTLTSYLSTCAQLSLPSWPFWPLSRLPMAKQVPLAIQPLGVSPNHKYSVDSI